VQAHTENIGFSLKQKKFYTTFSICLFNAAGPIISPSFGEHLPVSTAGPTPILAVKLESRGLDFLIGFDNAIRSTQRPHRYLETYFGLPL
jgi:hypothetical protein